MKKSMSEGGQGAPDAKMYKEQEVRTRPPTTDRE